MNYMRALCVIGSMDDLLRRGVDFRDACEQVGEEYNIFPEGVRKIYATHIGEDEMERLLAQ